MQAQRYDLQINLVELKAQLVKKLGPDRYKQYIFYLNKFLSLKLSKIEFNKVCLRILGRDNVLLHNQLIRSILKHACCAKTPAPASSIQKDGVFNHRKHAVGKHVSADGYQQRLAHAGVVQASGSPTLSNGIDELPKSPQKTRNRSHDQRNGNALGPDGKISLFPEKTTSVQPSDFNMESGSDLNPPVAVQPDHVVMHHVDQKLETLNSVAGEIPIVWRSSDIPDGPELLVTEKGSSRNPSWGPCWDPLFQFRISRGQRALPLAHHCRCQINGALLDSVELKERLDEIAVANGLEGVSLDSANLINHCLDSFMKGLIKSCNQLSTTSILKSQSSMMQMNGFKAGHSGQFQSSREPSSDIQDPRSQRLICFRELQLAMELNPQKLGEAWPMLLEKTCFHSSET